MGEDLLNEVLRGVFVGFLAFVMMLFVIVLYAYVKISDDTVRTCLYALLLPFFPVSAFHAYDYGGWWWIEPVVVVLLVVLVIKVDNAQPSPGWMHPWYKSFVT